MTNYYPPFWLLLFTLFGGFTVLPVSAQTVVTEVSPKSVGEAEYLPGDANQPAVLILHGFTTTRHFPTVESMASGLNLEGYSVLAPNLTMGITQRQHSIKCQAIHTHTLEQDAEEIRVWVNWLHQKGHKHVILIGHSAGSMQILYALSEHIVTHVDSVILTSLYYFNGPEVGSDEKDMAKAQQHLKSNTPTVDIYSFLFCKENYHATAKSFLSYQVVTRTYILNALRQAKMPITVIMGEKDKRYQTVGTHWLKEMKDSGARIELIKNANHFFSGDTEFDLMDRIIQLLQEQH